MQRTQKSSRAGHWVSQVSGYSAFVPLPLPPTPPIQFDAGLISLLAEATLSLGRLDGVATTLPNPNLFVAMYVRQEAVLSSQIEGTQSTLEDVLVYEAETEGEAGGDLTDVADVVNYVRAMNEGLARLDTLPLSLRLLREVHGTLMRGGRGGEKAPGEFRRTQNWIGPANCTLRTASFVPPPPDQLMEHLGALERYLHDHEAEPPLVQAALAHAQFETIHPFLDGNGRMGRLLIALLLCERRVLRQPVLYLSVYLKRHRTEYYDRLTAIRDAGDWEGWLRFFLRGVVEVSAQATATARAILDLRDRGRALLATANGQRLLDLAFEHPVVSVRKVERLLDTTYVTAGRVIDELCRVDLLREVTGHKRNRRFHFQPYLRLFQDDAP